MSPQPKPEPMPPPLVPTEEPGRQEEDPRQRHQPEPDQKARDTGSLKGAGSPQRGSSDKVVFDEDAVAK